MTIGSHAMPSQLFTSCDKGVMYCFSEWANTVTGGLFWILMLLGFAFAIFMATMRFGTNRAFAFGSFVGMIGAIWLSILQLISWWVASAFILTGVVAIGIMLITDK